MPRPMSLSSTRPRPALLPASKKPIAIRRRVTAPAQLTGNGNSNWQSATEARLEDVPPFYIVSTDSVRVCGNVDAQEVAGRIAEWLRIKSVASAFDGCIARCQTLDRCEFDVRIFREGDHLLVDVQMTRGDAFSYRSHADAILNAAQGIMSDTFDPLGPSSSLPSMSIPISEIQELAASDGSEIIDVLENTSELIQKERVDACAIGMETLAVLTKRDKVGDRVSALTSQAVLLGSIDEGDIIGLQGNHFGAISSTDNTTDDNDSDQDGTDDMGFMSIVFALVRDRKLQSEDEDDDNLRNPSYVSQLRYMRLLAFSVIDNSLQVMYDTSPCLQNRIARSFDRNGLFESLIRDIRDARENPHEAWYSVRILTSLVSTSESTRMRALHLGALAAVEGAHIYGLSYHALLASDSNALMTVLRLEPQNQ